MHAAPHKTVVKVREKPSVIYQLASVTAYACRFFLVMATVCEESITAMHEYYHAMAVSNLNKLKQLTDDIS